MRFACRDWCRNRSQACGTRTFSFVHIDLDIYSAIKSACEFFYCRMQPGGVLLFDDYGHSSCPGARAAVDEFFADKPEVKISIVTGQCSVQKLPNRFVTKRYSQLMNLARGSRQSSLQ